jgi:hypothetical protein
MKINEVLQEAAPNIADFSAGKVMGMPAAAVTGAGRAAAANQRAVISKVADKAIQSWAQQSQNLAASGAEINADSAEQWFTAFSGKQPKTTPTATDLNNIKPWLEKEVAAYLADKNAAGGTVGTNPNTAGSKFMRGFTKGYTGQDPGPRQSTPAATQQPQTAAPQPADAGEQPVQNTQTTPNQGETVQTVITPTGQEVLKKSDGNWYRQDGSPVDDANDIKKLNQMVISARETARAKGNPMPKVISAQTSQATNTAAQTSTTDATVQQSAGTQQPAPTTATNGDIFAGDTQQPEAPLPDVSQLTAAERAELRKQLQA